MSYILYGATYVGTGTLPTPVPGFSAKDTSTGNIYEANSSGTAWTLVGNANSAYLGLAPISGFTATGAIGGATGWAPLDSPNFTTSAKLGGVDLVTFTQLATQVTAINNNIAPKINSAVAAVSSGLSVKGSLAIGTGILVFTSNATQTIPMPTYPDGTLANLADCKFVVGLVKGYWPCGRSDGNGDTQLLNTFTTSNPTGYCVLQDLGGNYYSTSVWYLVIGVKP